MKQELKDLLKKKNVVGFHENMYKRIKGVETDIECTVVFVSKKVGKSKLLPDDIIPNLIDDIPTDVVETGEFDALLQGKSQRLDRKGKHRPIFGGISCGHPVVTACTLGDICFKEGITNKPMISSNTHCLCPHWEGAKIDDVVLQPGKYDGGQPYDYIAKVHDFQEIYFEGNGNGSFCPFIKSYVAVTNFLLKVFRRQSRIYSKLDKTNVMDCAIAKVEPDIEVKLEIYGDNEMISIAGVDENIQIGDTVYKAGRTTGWKQGSVQYNNATLIVNYGGGKTAIFEHQIITNYMSAGGDSGSTGLTKVNGNWFIFGRLFAGSDSSTIFCPIGPIIERFKLRYGG